VQDHEGVPHESIRRASIEEVRELHEAQEVEGLCVGLEIDEIPDRRERTGMGHVQPGHGWDLVVGTSSKGPSSFQMCRISSGAASIRWFNKTIRMSACLKSQFS